MKILQILPALAACGLALTPAYSSGSETDLGRIMFLGNSFIEGHDSPTLSWMGGSRKVVEDILTKQGVRFTFVGRNKSNSQGMSHPRHNGYGGVGINELFAGIDRDGVSFGRLEDWISESKADVYLIDIGRKEEEGSTLADLKAQFTRVVRAIYSQNPRARIIWSEQVAPKAVWFPKAASHLLLVNQALSEIANNERLSGRRMEISKATTGWNPGLHLDKDGVHPSDEGYRYLGRLQAEMLLKPMQAKRRA